MQFQYPKVGQMGQSRLNPARCLRELASTLRKLEVRIRQRNAEKESNRLARSRLREGVIIVLADRNGSSRMQTLDGGLAATLDYSLKGKLFLGFSIVQPNSAQLRAATYSIVDQSTGKRIKHGVIQLPKEPSGTRDGKPVYQGVHSMYLETANSIRLEMLALNMRVYCTSSK